MNIKVEKTFKIPGTDIIVKEGEEIEVLEAMKVCEECGTQFEGDGMYCEACASKKKKEEFKGRSSIKEGNRMLEQIVLGYIADDGPNAGQYLIEDILEIVGRFADDPGQFVQSMKMVQLR